MTSHPSAATKMMPSHQNHNIFGEVQAVVWLQPRAVLLANNRFHKLSLEARMMFKFSFHLPSATNPNGIHSASMLETDGCFKACIGAVALRCLLRSRSHGEIRNAVHR